MKPKFLVLLVVFLLPFALRTVTAQPRNYKPGPMVLDVGRFHMKMDKLNGEGGLQTQYSWMLDPDFRGLSEIFYWPRDRWQSSMLYQIFNPISLDDNGILDGSGGSHQMYAQGAVLTNPGATDWASETRRYRPPHIIVDGIQLDAPYRWNVDPTIPSDIKLEFEDVLSQFGIRSHVEIYAFSNPYHADYFIWKATHKFTGETKLPRNSTTATDTLVDQTIRFWWPIAFSFGPTKAGEHAVMGSYAAEGEDDLDNWFKAKTAIPAPGGRDSLTVAYYYDAFMQNTNAYTNGSRDDGGDPDRTNGHLYSTAIPGYALLHADKSASDRTDDLTQPYAMPHASIVIDLWNRRDVFLKETYRGDDARGRFPPDPITAGFSTVPQKGPMRFITVGPYTLTKDRTAGRFDSLTFVYAIGAGGINWRESDSIGHLWFTGQMSDSAKDAYFRVRGKDSLFAVLDRANWAWSRISQGLSIPSAPPPPDITVTSGPDRITVTWSYPDGSYFKNAVTGIDDWSAWRVYRKRGALLVDDPLDQLSGEQWEPIFETPDRSVTTFVDPNIQRGVDYYYAVTALNNGSQNTVGDHPGAALESPLYMTRSQLPAASFKPGQSLTTPAVRVVPNPATVAAGGLGFAGTPDKILFVNLPVKCTLRIFTETGDLVQTFYHYGTADESWNQRTDANQYVASGIYILTVTDSQALDGTPLDNQFVKFVIVR